MNSIYDYAFSKCVYLSELNVGLNKLKKVSRFAFNGGAYLRRLVLSNNLHISSIESYAFESLSQLEYLTLGMNTNLKELKENDFYGLANLKILDLSECQLKWIDKKAFVHLLKLEELYMSMYIADDKKISLFSIDSFTVMPSLKLAIIIRSQITHINSFGNWTKLERLILSSNEFLVYINPEALLKLTALTSISLCENNVNLNFAPFNSTTCRDLDFIRNKSHALIKAQKTPKRVRPRPRNEAAQRQIKRGFSSECSLFLLLVFYFLF